MLMKRTSNGFTLIELLIVISIIAVLAGLLFPVFATARGKAYQAQCTSNLRQLGNAIQMYGMDYDDRFPLALDVTDYPLGPTAYRGSGIPRGYENVQRLEFLLDPTDGDYNGGRIDHILKPFLRSEEIFRCPGDTGIGGIGYAAYTGPYLFYNKLPIVPLWQQARYYRFPQAKWGGTSYMYRTELGLWMKPASRLRDPSRTNVLMDGAHYWHTPLRRTPKYVGPGSTQRTINDDMADAQKGRFNVLFGDGHVRSITWEENYAVWATRKTQNNRVIETLWQEDIDITRLLQQGE